MVPRTWGRYPGHGCRRDTLGVLALSRGAHRRNAAKTAYGKGCRCRLCVEAERARNRRRYAADIEAQRERSRAYAQTHREEAAARGRKRYEHDPEGMRAKGREWRENGRERERERGRRRRERHNSIPVTAWGRYNADEDQAILGWQGTDLDLALKLGRSYQSIVTRKRRLRKGAAQGSLVRENLVQGVPKVVRDRHTSFSASLDE